MLYLGFHDILACLLCRFSGRSRQKYSSSTHTEMQAACQHAVQVPGSGKVWLLMFDSVQAVKVLAYRQGLHDS